MENLLGFARRNYLVPLPEVDSLEALNGELIERLREDLRRRLRGKPATKEALLAEEQKTLLAIPGKAFESRRVETPKASSLSLVRFDGNDYSVPTAYAYHQVTAVGGIEEVRLVVGSRLVARHPRHWGKGHTEFNPIHYLALLERKPGAFDYARPLEGWELPGCFAVLRRRQQSSLGKLATREFIKVLRLLEHTGLSELTGAVRYALSIGVTSADWGAVGPALPPGTAGRSILSRRASSLEGSQGSASRSWGLSILASGGVAMKKLETKSSVLLKHHLKALKLPTMHAECEKVAARCARENVDHLGFLLQLCELELIEREKRAAQRRLKDAKFPSIKTLESFDFQAQPSINKPLVSELMRCAYIDGRETIILIGNPGTGKTHLATALGVEACGRGKRVRFCRITELVTELIEAREERQLMRLKKQLSKLDLLILDELGYVPTSKLGAELLFEVISTAYERTSLIVTTNLPFEQWTEVLGSERLVGATLDRLTHRCYILEATGESYRLKDAKRHRSRARTRRKPGSGSKS